MGGNFYRIKTPKGHEIVPAPQPVAPIDLGQPNDVSLGGKTVLQCDLCDKTFVSQSVAASHYLRAHSDSKRKDEDWRGYFSPVAIHGPDTD